MPTYNDCTDKLPHGSEHKASFGYPGEGECPAPLDPDRLREDRDERRRMEREYIYRSDEN